MDTGRLYILGLLLVLTISLTVVSGYVYVSYSDLAAGQGAYVSRNDRNIWGSQQKRKIRPPAWGPYIHENSESDSDGSDSSEWNYRPQSRTIKRKFVRKLRRGEDDIRGDNDGGDWELYN